jgi:hypothetical protein
MARSLLRSGEEVNKINHIRSFGERQGTVTMEQIIRVAGSRMMACL